MLELSSSEGPSGSFSNTSSHRQQKGSSPSFFAGSSAKSLFGGIKGDGSHSKKTLHLRRSETEENRHRNSVKLEGLVHQYHLRDTIENQSDTKMTMSLINSAMSLKDDRRTFHYFLAMTAVYAGFIVPWTAAFSNSAFSITASQTVYVTDFLFGVDFLGVTKEKFDLWKSASLTETENTFPVTRTVLAVLFSAFNFLPFNAVVQLQDKGMWTFTGNLAMLQVISRLRFAMKSRTAMTDRSGSLHKFQHVFAKLLKTMVFMMLLLHFFCCTWIMVCKLHCVDYFAELDALSSISSAVEDEDVIAIRDSHDGSCWFARDTYGDDSIVMDAWRTSYRDSHLYFRTLFLSTAMFVGGENIEPVNTIESGVGFIGVIVGVAFTANLYGQTMSLIHSLDSRGHEFRKKMENIGETMEYLNLPTRLKERINLYYWYAWSKSGSAASSKGTGQFLTELSEPLAMEVQLICHSNVIGNIPFFQKADSAVIRRVLDKIKPELFLPGDYVFRHGDTANKLYMIQSGEVEILDDQGLHLVTLGEGKYFGEVSLLTDLRRTASAKAIGYCTTDTLSKESFNEIRAQFEDFNESIVELSESNQYTFNHSDISGGGRELLTDFQSRSKSGPLHSFSEEDGNENSDDDDGKGHPNPLHTSKSGRKISTSTSTSPTSSEVQAKMDHARSYTRTSSRLVALSNSSYPSHHASISESDARKIIADEVGKEMRAMREFFREEHAKIANSIEVAATAKQPRGSSKAAMGLGPSRKALT
mmetsp:Transcript_12350/g.22453  ORF Transcript_12350/g.22453 Transcript_12350/m.22453 type:complete len:757 (-) Transcript_12350:56-2326(-)